MHQAPIERDHGDEGRSMESITLTADGPRISRIVAGVWRMADWGFDTAQTFAWIETCLALGITSFDHADIYGNFTCERQFGAALALKPSLRTQMQIITKCGIRLTGTGQPPARMKHYNTEAAFITASVARSLTQLRTDHIDVLLIHRPDPLMDADEVARCFEDLRAQGKVLHFGVSNHSASQTALLQSRCTMTNQVEISLRHLETFSNGVLDDCQTRRMRPMAWSPLAGGNLLREDFLSHLLREMAHELGLQTPQQVALAWLLAHPAGIIPVVGSSKRERLSQAAAAAGIRMGREDWFRLWSAALGHEVA
jgi:predicted oxidoreductase